MRISDWSSDVCSSDLFQRRCTFTPRVCFRLPASHQRPEEVDKEDYQPCGHDNITKGGDLVPIRVGTSVIRDTPGHSAHPQEVHREEQNVYADEEDTEMNLTQELVDLPASDLREQVIEAGKKRKDPAKRQHKIGRAA